jgi:thiol-disulfide isomerase/thioredoxin
MRRLLCGLLVVALACLAVRASEDKTAKKDEKKSAGAGASFEDLRKELFSSLAVARKKKDQSAFGKVLRDSGRKLRKFVENNPKGADAPQALRLLEQIANGLISSGDEAGFKLAESTLKALPDKKAQAKFCKAIVRTCEGQVKTAQQIKANKILREQLEKENGKATVEQLLAGAEVCKKKGAEFQKLLNTRYAGILPDLSVGKAMPNLTSQDLEGKKVELKSLRGKVVVLDIWATWCGPCRAMIPHERELVKRLKDKPFVLVSISADAKKETLKEFLEKNEMPWTQWWNGATGGVITQLDVEYFPTIYVLDAKGIIRAKDVREEEMDKAVDKLLKEMEESKKSS